MRMPDAAASNPALSHPDAAAKLTVSIGSEMVVAKGLRGLGAGPWPHHARDHDGQEDRRRHHDTGPHHFTPGVRMDEGGRFQSWGTWRRQSGSGAAAAPAEHRGVGCGDCVAEVEERKEGGEGERREKKC